MIKEECELLIEEYVRWLRSGLAATKVDGACECQHRFLGCSALTVVCRS